MKKEKIDNMQEKLQQALNLINEVKKEVSENGIILNGFNDAIKEVSYCKRALESYEDSYLEKMEKITIDFSAYRTAIIETNNLIMSSDARELGCGILYFQFQKMVKENYNPETRKIEGNPSLTLERHDWLKLQDLFRKFRKENVSANFMLADYIYSCIF